MSPRGKYRTLPLKEKLAAIQEVDAGVKNSRAALKYGITKSTLTTILKAKDKLQSNASRFAPDRKRLRDAAYPDLGKAVLLWLNVTLLSSLGMLADAWNAVTSTTIRNCFQHAFGIPGCSIATSPDCLQTEDDDDESQVLSALKAHNIAADLNNYAGTDDNLCVCRVDTLDDLVAEDLRCKAERHCGRANIPADV
ncbi:hypothetical protein MTO96_020025 [Rhipicephalus appendiculatus]